MVRKLEKHTENSNRKKREKEREKRCETKGMDTQENNLRK